MAKHTRKGNFMGWDFKKGLGLLLRNQNLLISVLPYFRAEDIEKGLLVLPEELFNKTLASYVKQLAGPMVTEYYIQFAHGAIYLLLDLDLKQLGPVKARYMFNIEDFECNANNRRIMLKYSEDVKSVGNMLQGIGLKALLLKGSCLKTAIEYSKASFLKANQESVWIDLDQLPGLSGVLQSVTLKYVDCQDGTLKLLFDA